MHLGIKYTPFATECISTDVLHHGLSNEHSDGALKKGPISVQSTYQGKT